MRIQKSKVIFLFALFVLFPALALAHDSTIDISGPYDGQQYVTDTLPINISVQGTITHSPLPNGANVADSQACVSVDGGAQICQPAPTFAGRPPTYYNYLVPVTISSPGFHTLQAFTRKSDGGHPGQSAVITIEVILSTTSCDEVDPPAYANQYLNGLNLPRDYATYRGQIINVIAFNHSNGVYGSCTYNYPAVVADVDALLNQVGF